MSRSCFSPSRPGAAALAFDTAVHSLDLTCCALDDQALSALGAALSINTTMISLTIDDQSDFSEDGLNLLLEGLLTNDTLLQLFMCVCVPLAPPCLPRPALGHSRPAGVS